MQDQSCAEEPKINRLKRANRTKKSDLLRQCELIRPDADQKSSHTSIMKNTTPTNTHGSRCSPTKRGLLLNMETSQRPTQIDITSRVWSHQQPSVCAVEPGRLSRRGARAEGRDLHGYEEMATSTIQFIRDTRTREEILQQVQAQNPGFPVRRLFQDLQKRLVLRVPAGESESAQVVPVTRKRKREVKSHSDGRFHKHRRSTQGGLETLNMSESHVSSGHEQISRNRLRINPAPVQDAAMDESHQGHARHVDDMPWTEKFRPLSCDEVIGNSAAVRKLYSWLKDWRMRADVDERRKRLEERRIKESNGSWDCGDFHGDPLTEECERKLCNTLLIHGPTGVGKSAAVFACAEQLGFKVLEVNSSSLRTGHAVLSQLRESTQSHHVEAPQRSVSHTRTPAQKSVSSCEKPPSAAASEKKNAAAQTSVMLTRYCWKTGKLANKHSEISQDTKAADEVTLNKSKLTKDDALDKKSETALLSLILFEEVDIVFKEDVGFLAAVKSLMNTTKRPIILTTNDPAFGESFGGRFKEIRFKMPVMESVVSFLQCVCVVQSMKPDLEHICFMLQENNGDVRRSVLELELWARSGAGNTHHHLRNRALACRSYAELESSRCVEVLVDCWRKGRSLLYSYLDPFLVPPTVNKADQSTSTQDTICTTSQNETNKDPSQHSSRKHSGLKVDLKTKSSGSAVSLDSYKQMNQSAAEAGGFSQVDSLACFFDTVSFVDSQLSPRPCCKPGPLGAQVADGLLDEPRDEDEYEMKTHSLERCYEIQAVVEALGFHRCSMKACLIKQGDQAVTGRHQAVTGRDQAVTGRDQAVTGRDQAVTGRDQAVTRRDQAVTRRDQAVTGRDQAVTGRHQAVTGRDQDVTGRHQAVTRRDQDVTGRDQAVTRRDQAVTRRDQDVTGRDQDVTGRDQDVTGRHQDVTRRHQDVTGRHQDVTGRHQDVTGRDQDVTGRDQAVTGRDQAVTGRDQAVTGRDQAVTGRDQDVTGRDQDVTGRHQDVTGRHQDVTGRHHTWTLRERRSNEAVHRVLHSEAFRYHGAQTAMLTDYLPCLRFICREQSAKQPLKPRFSHYLRRIGLRLPKSLLDLLASPLH